MSCAGPSGEPAQRAATDPELGLPRRGPCWSPEWDGLAWVDMLAGDILTFGRDEQPRRQHVGSVAACVRPRVNGGQIIAVERGVLLTDAAGNPEREVTLWESPEIRMNEGGIAPDGTFYIGSMAYDQSEGSATLYRVSPDLEWEPVLENVTISNGIACPLTARSPITTTPLRARSRSSTGPWRTACTIAAPS